MKTKFTRLMVGLLLLGTANNVAAEVLTYTSCTVKDPTSFVTALSSFYDEMRAVPATDRPSAAILQSLWNGPNPTTHSITASYSDYAALEASTARIAANPGGLATFSRTMAAVATCSAEGLLIRRGVWGDEDADWEFLALYPLTVSDVGAYVKAFDKFANSQTGKAAPGPVILWENRAGAQGYTHLVVFTAPSLAILNTFLDSLLASKDYAGFAADVKSIRKLGQGSQSRKILTLEP